MELFPGLIAFTPFTVIIATSALTPLATAKSKWRTMSWRFSMAHLCGNDHSERSKYTRKCQMTLNMAGKKEMLFDSDCTL